MRSRKLRHSFVLVLFLAGLASAQAPRSFVPSSDNLDSWLEFIKPSKAETSWEKIGWRNEFWPAVEEARELGRPILLWTMNGHPLGCT